mgnify:FL=1
MFGAGLRIWGYSMGALINTRIFLSQKVSDNGVSVQTKGIDKASPDE